MARGKQAFRLVHRSFDHFEFSIEKSELNFELRGFDFGHATRMFPGLVAERQDTRHTAELRWQAIGEVMGETLFVVYTVRQVSAASSQQGTPNTMSKPSSHDYVDADGVRWTVLDGSDAERGRYDPERRRRFKALSDEERRRLEAALDEEDAPRTPRTDAAA